MHSLDFIDQLVNQSNNNAFGPGGDSGAPNMNLLGGQSQNNQNNGSALTEEKLGERPSSSE